jgi:phosphoesterase RecJ-like protein
MISDPNNNLSSTISDSIREKAILIWAEIEKAQSILLHCHPSSDPDSVGSTLGMKLALESKGKKVTLIKGDSEIPAAFMHFPGADTILMKNFFEIDQSAYDLFLVLDSSKPDMISKIEPMVFPSTMKVIVIDHHRSNAGYGAINIVDASYPATAQLVFDLLTLWNITITSDIARNLFMGIFTDTGGFKYEGTSPRTFMTAAVLVSIAPDFTKTVSKMENSLTIKDLQFTGLAMSTLTSELDGKLGIVAVPYVSIQEKAIPDECISAGVISGSLRKIAQFDLVTALIEAEPGQVRISFRTHDADRFDLSLLAVALGGGGHKAAAGASLNMSLAQARETVVAKIKELYNL